MRDFHKLVVWEKSHQFVQYKRFLEIAFGSASEVEYQLLLARDLGYLTLQTYDCLNEQVIEIKKMLAALKASVKRYQNP